MDHLNQSTPVHFLFPVQECWRRAGGWSDFLREPGRPAEEVRLCRDSCRPGARHKRPHQPQRAVPHETRSNTGQHQQRWPTTCFPSSSWWKITFEQSSETLTFNKKICSSLVSGQVVDHDALVKALQSGTIRAAALDVTHPKPLPRFLSLKRLIVFLLHI